ncbi:MAG: hypothetical protein AB7L91_15165 [Dehalococcoidia bacterium]
MGRVGDGAPARPDAGVVGDGPSVQPNPDPFQVRDDIDHPSDRVRVDGVVRGVEADVVVPAQADPFPPAQLGRDRRQWQHA